MDKIIIFVGRPRDGCGATKIEMDISQLSSKIKTLILEESRVVVPGLGTFVAEFVPASFSDRGYTINPPYRHLNFYGVDRNVTEDDQKGSVDIHVSEEDQKIGAERDVTEGKLEDGVDSKSVAGSQGSVAEGDGAVVDDAGVEALVERIWVELDEFGDVEFPELGKLRKVQDGVLLFVEDEELDIFPDGFGLASVSLKNREAQKRSLAKSLKIIAAGQQEIAGPVEVGVAQQEIGRGEGEPVEQQVVNQQLVEMGLAGQKQKGLEPGGQEVDEEPEKKIEQKADQKSGQSTRGKHTVLKVLVLLLVVCAVALAVFKLAAIYAPDFVDTLLYSPEELEILRSRI